MIRNTVQKEILESDHPKVALLTNNDMIVLKQAFANPSKLLSYSLVGGVLTPGTTAVTTPSFTSSPASASFQAGTYLWNLFVSGVKSVEVKQPIIRLTRTANPLYSSPFNTANIDTILQTTTMISDSGLPSSFAVPVVSLATRLINKSGGVNPVTRPDGLTLYFGWLKDLVGDHKHGRERIQFVLEYKFGLYDVTAYGQTQPT